MQVFYLFNISEKWLYIIFTFKVHIVSFIVQYNEHIYRFSLFNTL